MTIWREYADPILEATMSDRASALRDAIDEGSARYACMSDGGYSNVRPICAAIVRSLGITPEMVYAVRDALPDVTYANDGTPFPMSFQRWDELLTDAADILQALLDAGGDDG